MSNRKTCGENSSLDFIFRVPKKLTFSRLYRYYFDFILRLLYRVILIDDIPETVSETFLKLILYTQGKVCFLEGSLIGEDGDKLLSLNCTRADTPDVYYIPHKVLVVNPRLRKSYNIEPGKDCEVVYLSEADKYNIAEQNGGLWELISSTATLLADNVLSINIAQKNTRLTNIVSGDTQNTVDSIRAVIAAMYEGDPSIVVKSSLIDKLQGIPIIDNSTQQNLVQLIQVHQYILSHFFEQIGLTTHDNMKKERLITAEINDNLQLALFNIDDILFSIQEGLDRVNAMFDTKMKVRLNPIIEQQRKEAEAAAEEEPAAETEPEPEPEAAAEEEPAAEPEPEPEEDQEPEPEPEPEAAAEEEPEPEPEEEPEPELEPEPEVTLEVSGDNNIIVIGGDDLGTSIHVSDEDGADALERTDDE